MNKQLLIIEAVKSILTPSFQLSVSPDRVNFKLNTRTTTDKTCTVELTHYIAQDTVRMVIHGTILTSAPRMMELNINGITPRQVEHALSSMVIPHLIHHKTELQGVNEAKVYTMFNMLVNELATKTASYKIEAETGMNMTIHVPKTNKYMQFCIMDSLYEKRNGTLKNWSPRTLQVLLEA